jgi:hypothetical protein
MECNICHKKLDLTEFSYKNKKDKIYYLCCNKCREKSLEYNNTYKYIAKIKYESLKESNNIKCECGIEYVAFRTYHIYRHNSTKKHQDFINKSKPSVINL